MRRTPPRVVALVACCFTLVSAACSSDDAGEAANTTASTAAPPMTAPAAPPVVAAEGEVFAISPWFVSGETIVQGQARFAVGPEVMASALAELMAGPTDADRQAGLTTGIVPRAEVRSLSLDGTTAVVDFTRPFETADTQPQVAQVVWTLTEFAGVDQVKFLVDGEDNGATGTRPLTRDNTRLQPPG
jgi:spore germination protein GerM